MKTKLFTFFLAFASVGIMFAEKVQIGDLYYNLDANNKTAEVTNQNGSNWPWWSITITTAQIPTTVIYNDVTYSVTSIGDQAFRACVDLTSVTIPNSIISIGKSAFNNCVGLTSIEIPNSVISIGEGAFFSCNGLTSINIPNSVTTIGEEAFALCSRLISINISNSVTSIESKVFSGCSSLTYISIPNSVTSIGKRAFEECGLASIEIPESVTNIEHYAFYRCSNLNEIIVSSENMNYSSEDGVLFNKDKSVLIQCPCNHSGDYIIPVSVTNIGDQAFDYCKALTSIEIPNSVISIGEGAFWFCGNLSSITCKAITPPSCQYYSGEGVFYKVNKAIPLYVPSVSINAYKAADQWKDFPNIQAIHSAPLVQFLDWDGTVLSSAYVDVGSAAIPPANPSREGYTFIGWDKDFNNITEDLIVTAQYKINRYEVIFEDWDETILKTDSVDYNNPAYAPANPSREGHEFIGWDKDYSHVTSDMTIKAQYAVNYYAVEFLNYDGTLLSEQSIAYNQAAMEPNVPTREGYTFIGWTADIEHITARTFAIALYEKDGINVTYISEEGDTIVSEKVDMHLPDAPIVSGKTFSGWLTESASNAEGIVFRATYTLDNPTTGEDVVVIPTSSTAGVSFPYITGAMTYMLVIRDLFGTVVCKIMFDADGHLLGIAFAPGRNRTQKAQSEGFHFTVEGLTPGTTYEYELVAYDEADQVIETLTGSFETTADETGVNNISSASAPQKVINDGHVFVLRGDKTYTMQGQEVK